MYTASLFEGIFFVSTLSHTHTYIHIQTGSETSVERLMKQITSFMSEISDEFKTIVVEAIQSVCIKFPRKHHILMTFLSSMLREEGGMEYKRAIVNTIITIIEENQDVKEAGEWVGHGCGLVRGHQRIADISALIYCLFFFF